MADVVEVYKLMSQIDTIDMDKFFTSSMYTTTRVRSMKLFKKQYRFKLRSNSFSIRVVVAWNSLPDSVVKVLSLDCFKARLNSHWKSNPYKFNLWCYIPG